MPVLSALLNYYPHLQALSASSPIWAGVDTGYASNRALMFQQLPTAGLPFQFERWEEFEAFVARPADHRRHRGAHRDPLGRAAGAAPRAPSRTGSATASPPSPRWPRWSRSCTAWSSSSTTGCAAGETLPTMPPWHVQENKWRAARYGLDAIVILDAESNERLVTDDLADLRRAARAGRRAARLLGRAGLGARHPDARRVVPAPARGRRAHRRRPGRRRRLRRAGAAGPSSASSAALGRHHLEPHAEQPHRAVLLDPVEQADRRVGEDVGSLVDSGEGEAAADRDERPVAELEPDPGRRPALLVDVLDHLAGQRAHLVGDLRPVVEIRPGTSSPVRGPAAPTAPRPPRCR